ncbi:DnaJ domain-containing protein, partial [Thamnocephalis sphaerospora]
PDTDLYSVLEVASSATADEIKRAYRRLALRHHPDKQPTNATPAQRAQATHAFQRVGLVYAVLSDEKRRARYDRTGEFGDTLGLEEGADWDAYFRELFDRVDEEKLQKFAAEYRDSAEERSDLLAAYEQHQGDFDHIFEELPVVNVLDDEDRLRIILERAIEAGDVAAHRAFTHESRTKRLARQRRARKEAADAERAHAQLTATGKKNSSAASSEADLAMIIQQRGAKRMATLIAGLEEKYASKAKKTGRVTKKAAASKEPRKRTRKAAA